MKDTELNLPLNKGVVLLPEETRIYGGKSLYSALCDRKNVSATGLSQESRNCNLALSPYPV